jgi:F0F1-type ATP synthase assembly protein I
MVPDRPGARYLRTILSQLLVLLLAVPVLLAIADRGSALSLLLGGSCALLPQALFALQMRAAARESAARAARLGLLAEAWKFLLSVALFAVVRRLMAGETQTISEYIVHHLTNLTYGKLPGGFTARRQHRSRRRACGPWRTAVKKPRRWASMRSTSIP